MKRIRDEKGPDPWEYYRAVVEKYSKPASDDDDIDVYSFEADSEEEETAERDCREGSLLEDSSPPSLKDYTKALENIVGVRPQLEEDPALVGSKSDSSSEEEHGDDRLDDCRLRSQGTPALVWKNFLHRMQLFNSTVGDGDQSATTVSDDGFTEEQQENVLPKDSAELATSSQLERSSQPDELPQPSRIDSANLSESPRQHRCPGSPGSQAPLNLGSYTRRELLALLRSHKCEKDPCVLLSSDAGFMGRTCLVDVRHNLLADQPAAQVFSPHLERATCEEHDLSDPSAPNSADSLSPFDLHDLARSDVIPRGLTRRQLLLWWRLCPAEKRSLLQQGICPSEESSSLTEWHRPPFKSAQLRRKRKRETYNSAVEFHERIMKRSQESNSASLSANPPTFTTGSVVSLSGRLPITASSTIPPGRVMPVDGKRYLQMMLQKNLEKWGVSWSRGHSSQQ